MQCLSSYSGQNVCIKKIKNKASFAKLFLVCSFKSLNGCLNVTIGIQLRVEHFLDDTILSNDKGDTARQQSKHRLWYFICSAKLLFLVRQDVELESLL